MTKYQVIQKQIKDYIGNDCAVIYSNYELDENKNPVNNLDTIAVEGKAIFVLSDYMSNMVENPTWLEVTKIANQAIKATETVDHIYLEGLDKVYTQKDTNVYKLSMGS